MFWKKSWKSTNIIGKEIRKGWLIYLRASKFYHLIALLTYKFVLQEVVVTEPWEEYGLVELFEGP